MRVLQISNDVPYFNPRPREGSDPTLSFLGSTLRNFNPRPREGSDFHQYSESDPKTISIHAPVKGATNWTNERLFSQNISIHAPVKGATLQTGQDEAAENISIHAPVKGAT